MNQKQIKMKYSIARIGDFNYWAIPKCGNTAMKALLFMAAGTLSGKTVVERRDPNAWLHSTDLCEYLTPDQANSNGNINITMVRSPIARFYSLVGDKRIHGMTGIDLVKHLRGIKDWSKANVHFRPQSYFLAEFNGTIFDLDDFARMPQMPLNQRGGWTEETAQAEDEKLQLYPADIYETDRYYLERASSIYSFQQLLARQYDQPTNH